VTGVDPLTIRRRRLILTGWRADDADLMVEVLADEQLYEFIGGRAPTDDELRVRNGRIHSGSPNPDEIWFNWIVRRRRGSLR